MATEFIATVKPSGGDYSSLSAAEAGLNNDLTAATIKVFSISAASTPTIVAGDTVLGVTSLATGVCVLVNAARTQILIKTIAVAAFQSGETVQKTSDAGVTVTLSSAGDSPIVGIACYSMSDTTATTIDGWTTAAGNYISIYGAASDKTSANTGIYSTERYRIEITNANHIVINELFVRIDGIQFAPVGTGYAVNSSTAEANGFDRRITNCIIKGNSDTTRGIYHYFPGTSRTGNLYIWNCIAYDFLTSAAPYFLWMADTGTAYLYNNTIVNCGGSNGAVVRGAGTVNLINCLFSGCALDASGTISDTYCATTNDNTKGLTAGGTGNLFSKTMNFANEAGKDFHLTSASTDVINVGSDLSATFTTDIDGTTRPTGANTWDIGADEYVAAAGGLSIPVAAHHYRQQQ